MSVKRAFFGIFQKLTLFCCAIFFGFTNAFSANLPSGYTELEYIESTGTQYIDTGIVGTINTDIEIKGADFTGNAAQLVVTTTIASVADGSSQLRIAKFAATQKVGAGIGTGTPTYSTSDGISQFVAKLENHNLYLDGQLVGAVSTDGFNQDEMGNVLILSGVYGSNRYYGVGKVYYVKIWDNNTLVRDFVPAKQGNTVGMYDLVSGQFFTNQGTGTFTSGRELDPCRNLFDPNTVDVLHFYSASLGYANSDLASLSGFIPVTAGQSYTLSGTNSYGPSWNIRVNTFNANQQIQSQLVQNVPLGSWTYTLTIPAGISYIRYSFYKDDVNIQQLEQGSTATAYVPYNASCHNTNGIKIATTAYNTARFNPVVNDLNSTVATIREIVTNTINQTAAIASLQADKQTRPEDACPAGKKCLLVETEENGVIVPHWYEIIENVYGLPSGYTALEYIQSDGNSWIDTGIKGNMGYKYDIEFQQLDAGRYRNWGAFNQETFSGGPNMSLTYGVGFIVRWTVTGANTQLVQMPSLDTNRHHLVIDNGNITWDGVAKGRSTGHQNNYQLNYNLFLGTINPGGTTPTSNAKSKYYSYKVWNGNGDLIQNFVPAKNSSGVIGMYDTVNDRFLTNAGTGTFTAGPEI